MHTRISMGLLLMALLFFSFTEAQAVRCANSIAVTPAASQDLCFNATATQLVASVPTTVGTGPVGNVTYTWYSNTVNSTSGGTIVQGPTARNVQQTSIYIPLTTTPGTLFYYAVVANTGTCGTTTFTSPTIPVTVSAASTPVGTAGSRCGAGTVLLSATATAGETIDWYAAPTGGTALLTGSTTFTTPGITTTTTYYAEGRNTSTGCLSVTRTAVTATIYNTPVAPPGTGGAACGTGTVILSASAGAGETIDWYDAASGGTPLLAGSPTFTTPGLSATTTYYAEARNTLCATVSPTRTAVIATINPVPTLGTVLQASPVCSGFNATINLTSLLASTPQTISYTINGGGTQTVSITSNASGNASFTLPVTSVNNGQPLTITAITVNATACASTFTSGNTVSLQVNASPSITSQPSASGQALCKNATAIPLSVSAVAGNGTIITYDWYSNTINTTSGGTLVVTHSTAATTDAYTPVTTTAGTVYYYVVITNSNTCSVTSQVSGAIVVSNGSIPTITTQPSGAGQEMCLNGLATTLSVTATGSSLTYQWYSSSSSNGSGSSLVNGATATTFIPPTNGAGTRYYYCQVSSNSCSITSAVSGAITVYPTSVGGTISGATTVCAGTNNTVLTLSGETGSIQWQSSSDNSSFADISGETASTYTVIDLAATTYYRVVVTNGVCTSATSSSVMMGVTTGNAAGTISGAAAVCSGTNSTPLTISGNSGPGQWQSSSDNLAFTDIPGETSATYSALNLANTTYYRVRVTGPCATTNTPAVAITVLTPGAMNWTGNVDTDWSNPGNWTCGPPNQNLDVTIPAGLTNYPVVGPTLAEVRNITISNGASLTLSAGTVLMVYGNWTNNNATASAFVSDYSEVTFTGAGAHAVNGPTDFYHLTIDDANGVLSLDLNGVTRIGGVLTLTANTTVNTQDQLTLVSLGNTTDLDGSIGPIPAGAVLNGQVTVNRFMHAFGYSANRYLSVPVANQTSASAWSDDFQVNNISVRDYQETVPGDLNQGFTNQAMTSPLQPGRGYLAWMYDGMTDVTWDAQGTIYQGSMALPVSYTATSGGVNADGWNLVGNPYPSSITWSNDANDWTRSPDISPVVFVTDMQSNQFIPFNYTDNTGEGGVIAMGQSFWVKATAANPSLTIHEPAKSSTAFGRFYRQATTPSSEQLIVTLQHGALRDKTYLKINDKATRHFDHDFDGDKLMNETLNIYLRDEDQRNLVMHTLSTIPDDLRIPLVIEVKEAGDYQISLATTEPAGPTAALYLIDAWAGVAQAVTAADPYQVHLSGADIARPIADRFYLSRNPAMPERKIAAWVQAFPNPVTDMLTVRLPAYGQANVTLLDAQGRTVWTDTLQGERTVDFSTYPSGLFLLKISDAHETVTLKIVK